MNTACVKYQHEYRTCSMKCYTETWLTDAVRDSHVNIEGFSLFRGDRIKDSCKKIGDGLCLFVNEKWCHRNSMAVKHKVCTPNVEMLTVSVRPYYLPREFFTCSCHYCFCATECKREGCSKCDQQPHARP